MSKINVPNEAHVAIREVAAGRPYTIVRHVGNRVEVMFYGAYEPTAFVIDPQKGTQPKTGEVITSPPGDPGEIDLSAKTVAELKEICVRLGIPTSKKKKADLVSAIEAAIGEDA